MPEKQSKNEAPKETKKRVTRRRVKEVPETEKKEYQPPEALKGPYSELLDARSTPYSKETIVALIGKAKVALDEADVSPLDAALFTRQIYAEAEAYAGLNEDTASQTRWSKAKEKANKTVASLTPPPPDKPAAPSPVPPKSKMTGTTGM